MIVSCGTRWCGRDRRKVSFNDGKNSPAYQPVVRRISRYRANLAFPPSPQLDGLPWVQLAWPEVCPSCSLIDDLPQRRTRLVPETIHPVAFASGVVILANLLARNVLRRLWRFDATLVNFYVAALIARLQVTIQPEFHAQLLTFHTCLHILADNLIVLAVIGKRVVVGDDPLLDMAESGAQLETLRQRAMQVLCATRRSCELRVPFRPVFLLQEIVRRLHGLHFGEAKLLDQPILIGEKTPFHAPLRLR